MRLIFSRDRAAQLDLLLRSIEKHLYPVPQFIMASATTEDFLRGYDARDVPASMYEDFDAELRSALRFMIARNEKTVTFFCDDNVCIRDHDLFAEGEFFDYFPTVLTYSLRLGINSKRHKPKMFPVWKWQRCERHDFGFPGSIDGHVFRIADVQRAIENDHIASPTMLETVLAAACEHMFPETPKMACPYWQVVVGVPVNRVSPHSGVPAGEMFPCSPEEANERFLAGQRISLDSIDVNLVGACHREFEFIWEPRS